MEIVQDLCYVHSTLLYLPAKFIDNGYGPCDYKSLVAAHTTSGGPPLAEATLTSQPVRSAADRSHRRGVVDAAQLKYSTLVRITR